MKNKKAKLSKRTLGLLVATLVLVLATGGMGARAALSIFSEDYNAEFALDHLNVALLENGEIAAEKEKEVDGQGELLYHGHEKDGLRDGIIQPGRVYKEEIAARNMRDVDEYVRLSIRKYWCYTEVDENGNKTRVKDTTVDPSLIELYYVDENNNRTDFNTSAWQRNDAESTNEREVYYLTGVLKGEADAPVLVNRLCVNGKIVSQDDEDHYFNVYPEEITTEDGKKQTIYTYEYAYDGYRVCIEADVQSIQTHNSADAVTSLWGVENVTAADGKITVN